MVLVVAQVLFSTVSENNFEKEHRKYDNQKV